jgi:N-acetylmuramoyl-L-alanine amidase
MIKKFTSPNVNERAGGQKPKLIILHYTGTLTEKEAHDIYMTPDKVSPHYMINKDGDISQYVDEDKRAWHAGISYWRREYDINSSSIGIEIVNSGHEHDLEEFPAIQIEKLIELLRGIKSRWHIQDQNILGHSDIAVGRKIDPGERFPWESLEAEGIGLLPHVNKFNSDKSVFDLLREWGYDPTQPVEILKREFCRHYLRHHKFENVTNDMISRAISSLLHQSQ